MARVVLDNVRQTAYWWIKVIRIKVNEISRNPGFFTNEEYEFFKMFSDFKEENWRKLYLGLIDYIPPKSFSQSTSKKGHQQINDAISKILGIDIPDISLSPQNGKQYILDTRSRNIYVSCKTKERIPFEYQTNYSSDYNYVIAGDESDLKLYNLVLAVIIMIQRKSRNFKSLSFLRDSFCKKFISDNKLVCPMDEVIRNFNAIIKVLREYSLIECESSTGNEKISKWPMMAKGLNTFSKIASEYSEYILEEYEKYLSSRVVTPIVSRERFQKDTKRELRKNLILAEIETAEHNASGFSGVYREENESSASLIYFDDDKNEMVFNYDGLIEIFKSTIKESNVNNDSSEKGDKCEASYYLNSPNFNIVFKGYVSSSISFEDEMLLVIKYNSDFINVEIIKNLRTGMKIITVEYRYLNSISATYNIEIDSEGNFVYKPMKVELKGQYDSCPYYFDIDSDIIPWDDIVEQEIGIDLYHIKKGKKAHVELINDIEKSVIEKAREFAVALPTNGLLNRLDECLGTSAQDCNRMRKVANG